MESSIREIIRMNSEETSDIILDHERTLVNKFGDSVLLDIGSSVIFEDESYSIIRIHQDHDGTWLFSLYNICASEHKIAELQDLNL